MEWNPLEEFTPSWAAKQFNKNHFLCISRKRTGACLWLWMTVQFAISPKNPLMFMSEEIYFYSWSYGATRHFFWSQCLSLLDAVIPVLTFSPHVYPSSPVGVSEQTPCVSLSQLQYINFCTYSKITSFHSDITIIEVIVAVSFVSFSACLSTFNYT